MSATALYGRIFEALAGRHPHLRVTHHQYLATADLNRDLKRLLPTFTGVVLDVGSRDKPYGPWLGPQVDAHIGLDVVPGPGVDVVIGSDQRVPIKSTTIDAVLCTQVLEFLDDPATLLAEVARCLRPGGRLVLSVPFIANQHGSSGDDLLRLSAAGAARLVAQHLEVDEVRKQGGAGSTLASLALTWFHLTMSGHRRWLRAPLLPLLLVLHVLVNGLGVLLDKLDVTERLYGNVLVVAHRPWD